jgi:hypothetical protein
MGILDYISNVIRKISSPIGNEISLFQKNDIGLKSISLGGTDRRRTGCRSPYNDHIQVLTQVPHLPSNKRFPGF